MSTVAIREFTMADYPAALALWKDSEGVSLGDSDSEENLERFLERNPDLSFVAYAASHLVGSVLCGHDGRHGYIHRLAVARGYRRQGIGTALTLRCVIQLRAYSIHKCCLLAPKDTELAKAFWERLGWTERGDRSVMTRDVRNSRRV